MGSGVSAGHEIRFVRVPWLPGASAICVGKRLVLYVERRSDHRPLVGPSERVRRHEAIHCAQRAECGRFDAIYVSDYLAARKTEQARSHPDGRHWGAYYMVRFEAEAHACDEIEGYLDTREPMAWQAYPMVGEEQ